VPGYNVVEALDACSAQLSRYGGHAAAAGLACASDSFDALVEGLVAHATGQRPEGGWTRLMPVDAQVDLGVLTTDAVQQLEVLEPCGQGNPPPRFCVRGVELKAASAFGQEGEHLRLWVSDGPEVLEAIGWRRGGYIDRYRKAAQRGERLDAVFAVGINHWDGAETVLLELEDVRRSPAGVPAAT
jgi:single-stranded-DNA-specific exonuclease